MSSELPIQAIQQEVLQHWQNGGAIVGAPPGSGKTTQLPLWLLQANDNPIYLLIPKRLAVKLAAKQLSQNAGVQLGEEIGYVLRNERKVSRRTQLVVTTYGSFLRMLLNDPDRLTNSTILLDEFHERSAEQDLVYALVNQYIDVFDDSVRRIIMSATLNVEKIAQQTGLPIVESEGFSHPVSLLYQPMDSSDAQAVASLIRQQANQSQHNLLVFCAGLREIRRLESELHGLPTLVMHGSLDKTPDIAQLDQGSSTIILATNIAESSVTLPNVHTVIDLGYERFAQTHPVTGITELKTRRISQASAIQRAGRAGRLGPGKAIRLWSEDNHQSLIAHQPAEINQIDLTDIVLQTAYWGANRNDLPWLDTPPEQRWQIAQEKLTNWAALVNNTTLTDHGKAMFQSGLESWLAHLLSLAQQQHCLDAACMFAAHLMQSSPIQYDLFASQALASFPAKLRQEASGLAKRLNHHLGTDIAPFSEMTLTQALSDRILHTDASEKTRLISGTEVTLKTRLRSSWGILLDGIRQSSKILAHSVIEVSEQSVFSTRQKQESIHFHPNSKPEFSRVSRIGHLVLTTQAIQPTSGEKESAWLNYVSQKGEQSLQWDKATYALKNRWLIAQTLDESWPPWPSSNEWPKVVQPFLSGIERLSHLPLLEVLKHHLGHERIAQLRQLLPDQWQAPSGRSIQLSYQKDPVKVVAELKLQECFGLATQPRVGFNLPIQLDLLAPNGRPVASVTDVSHFWLSVYPEVRKELRGRYAKHPWPEDPSTAQATQKTNRQLRAQN